MSTLSEGIDSVKAQIDALITDANETTGKSDTTIGDAVKSLKDGYGGSGSDNLPSYLTGKLSGELTVDYSVTDISAGIPLLQYQPNLTKITLNVSGSKTVSMTSDFVSYMAGLEELNFNLSNNGYIVYLAGFIGKNLSALKTINLNAISGTISLGRYFVDQACPVTKIDISGALSFSNSVQFTNATSLQALIIRSSKMATPATNMSGNLPTDWATSGLKIYVPSSLVDTYKANTYWATVSDIIVAIEDYSDDGTVNGNINV